MLHRFSRKDGYLLYHWIVTITLKPLNVVTKPDKKIYESFFKKNKNKNNLLFKKKLL